MDLEREFPRRVCEYVAAASERKNDSSGRKRDWTVRKADHVHQIASAPTPARAIVLADKLHNLLSMLFDLEYAGPLWDRFNATAEQIIHYHRQIIAAAWGNDERLRPLAEQSTVSLDRLESARKR